MVKVSGDEVLLGYRSYRNLTRSAFNQNSYQAYLKLLEVTRDDVGKSYDILLPEEAVNRIRWLTGPNAAVLYKVWKAQNG